MRIFVEGEPFAARSKKKGVQKEWELRVSTTCVNRRLPKGNYRVRLDFVIPRPRYDLNNTQNTQGKDLDNLVSPVFHALDATLLRDSGGDGAIVELFATKRKSTDADPPGVHITITPR